MNTTFVKIVKGEHWLSISLLLLFMLVAPAAMFTDYMWLDVLGWIMLISLGALIFLAGIMSYVDAKNSYRWPRVPAQLLSCSLRANSHNGRLRYMPTVKCEFTVRGKQYDGAQYDFSASYLAKEVAQRQIDEVKANFPLLVYYKPSDPSISVIHPGVSYSHYLRIFFGLAAIVMPILIWSGKINLA